MKLVTYKKDILFKTDQDIEWITWKIHKDIWNSNILSNVKRFNKKKFWTDKIIDEIDNLEITSDCYDVYQWEGNDSIIVSGDNGLIELEIIDIYNIQKL